MAASVAKEQAVMAALETNRGRGSDENDPQNYDMDALWCRRQTKIWGFTYSSAHVAIQMVPLYQMVHGFAMQRRCSNES